MQSNFSPNLIKNCQKIFKRRSSIDIDEEQAELILERLAKLGLLIAEIKIEKGGEFYESAKNKEAR